MDKNDKQLVKNSALVIIDNAVATVDAYWAQKTGTPMHPLGICWGLVKALYANVVARRKERAMEIVKMVDENKTTFTPEVLSDIKFQDGFIYEIERYLIERSEEKRKIARNILIGFAKAEDKEDFPLERMSHVLTQLSETDIEILRDVNIDEVGLNYQVYGDSDRNIENIFNLISQGALLNTTGTRGGYDTTHPPFVKLSVFGKGFIKYIKDEA